MEVLWPSFGGRLPLLGEIYLSYSQHFRISHIVISSLNSLSSRATVRSWCSGRKVADEYKCFWERGHAENLEPQRSGAFKKLRHHFEAINPVVPGSTRWTEYVKYKTSLSKLLISLSVMQHGSFIFPSQNCSCRRHNREHRSPSPRAHPLQWSDHDHWLLQNSWGLPQRSCPKEEVPCHCGRVCSFLPGKWDCWSF